ncbi:hypothetical protein [Gymnodinialimonas sp. 57CJ19]|uniref:hypothetical protein n=1 Tax=Gymnodinialimonas sp. 57CJ19 TaxID=3138498 RepID=UPI0031343DE5
MSSGGSSAKGVPGGSSAKGVLASVLFAGTAFAALVLSVPEPPLPDKLDNAPEPGIIGRDDRVPLARFTPDTPEDFPGWEDVQNAVVRISCNGGGTGGGVLIGDGTRMLSAAHVFYHDDGDPDWSRINCMVLHPRGDAVAIRPQGMKSGRFGIPEELGGHFSIAITRHDWVIVPLVRAPHGAVPLPLADRDTMVLEQGARVINIAGPQDNLEIAGFNAQVCRYFGVPPTASHLVGDEIIGRLAEPGDEWHVARYDCDLGRGGSGSGIFGWHEGAPYVWGIVTDSLRGADRCPEVGYSSCYSAGPLVTTMDILP